MYKLLTVASATLKGLISPHDRYAPGFKGYHIVDLVLNKPPEKTFISVKKWHIECQKWHLSSMKWIPGWRWSQFKKVSAKVNAER